MGPLFSPTVLWMQATENSGVVRSLLAALWDLAPAWTRDQRLMGQCAIIRSVDTSIMSKGSYGRYSYLRTVQARVVTEWPLHICFNYSTWSFQGVGWIKPRTQDISVFINIYCTDFIKILNLYDFLANFGWLLWRYFGHKWNLLMLVLGSPFRDRVFLGTKQTQDKPNSIRGYHTKPASHIQPLLRRLCGKFYWDLTSPNANVSPPYFDAMWQQCLKTIFSVYAWTCPFKETTIANDNNGEA